MSGAGKRDRRTRGRTRRNPSCAQITERALSSAEAMQAAGRLARIDRMSFAWGWAEGFRAARRELGGSKGT
jgi:hypothetical protein